MGLRGRIFAGMYDKIMASTEAAGLHDYRQALLGQAKGQVLEIGAGTGANLPLYGAAVDHLALTEPEPPMVRRLQAHLRELGQPATVLRAPAEDLPFEDDTFDVAVSTLVLCTTDDQPRAVRELHRVLRPGGQLLFIEHVRADSPDLARWQDRLNGINRFVGHGCNCNRPTLSTLTGNGFTVNTVVHDQLPKAPPWIRPLVRGTAEKSNHS